MLHLLQSYERAEGAQLRRYDEDAVREDGDGDVRRHSVDFLRTAAQNQSATSCNTPHTGSALSVNAPYLALLLRVQRRRRRHLSHDGQEQ